MTSPRVPVILLSLRSYLTAVFKQAWTYVGLVTGAIGYGLDVFTDLKPPAALWISIFVGSFIVAQFRVYHALYVDTTARTRGIEGPPWTRSAGLEHSDGTWLTLLVMGDLPRKTFDTTTYLPLVQAVDKHFQLSEQTRRIEGYSDVLRITVPKEGVVADFMVRVSVQQHGYLCIQYRIQADPVPLTWILQSLDQALSFVLSDVADRVLHRDRRDYIVSLSGLPAGGVALPPDVVAQRVSFNHLTGMRVARTLRLTKGDKDGRLIIREFVAAVLSDIGLAGFEPSLDARDIRHLEATTTTPAVPAADKPDPDVG